MGSTGHRAHRRIVGGRNIRRLRQASIGLVALALAGGAVALTGAVLTGGIKRATEVAHADFTNCGQGLRVGGDVKLRGVLVGTIEGIERTGAGTCRVALGVFPNRTADIPGNSGAQIRAKTIFGEKWVELLYPDEPTAERLGTGELIPEDRTIDPLEVETILNVALPLLDAIDPEHLAGALTALADGFAGHEDAAITGIESGIEALRPLNRNEASLEEGIAQLRDTGGVLRRLDEDLVRAFADLDRLNRFTSSNARLVAANLDKAPLLLDDLSILFRARFTDLTTLVDRGATVVSVLAARADDLDRLLNALPVFNSNWIRNLDHVCRHRQATDQPGKSVGDVVPGRCWRVHNIMSHSRGAYAEEGDPHGRAYRDAGPARPSSLRRLLFRPAVGGPR